MEGALFVYGLIFLIAGLLSWAGGFDSHFNANHPDAGAVFRYLRWLGLISMLIGVACLVYLIARASR